MDTKVELPMSTEHADRGTGGGTVAARFGSLAAGTRIHTDTGLVAVEALTTGSLVLSANESDSDDSPQYRRVIRTLVYREVPLRQVSYLLEGRTIGSCVADNLPFWTREAGWVRAESLNPPDLELVLKDGRAVRCVENEAIRMTNKPAHGWVANFGGSHLGTELDLTGQMEVVASNVRWKRPKESSADSRLKVAAYGIEVEDNAPYFIGRAGILVRS